MGWVHRERLLGERHGRVVVAHRTLDQAEAGEGVGVERVERAGLLDQLAAEIGIAPDLIGTRGSGATAVRTALYRKSIKDPAYLTKKKIVVWCFTAREFTESESGWQKLPVAK